MKQVIYTNHANERIHERITRTCSEADIQYLAEIAWQKRYSKPIRLAFAANRQLAKARDNTIISEAGGFYFIFAKAKPVLITIYSK